VQITDLKKYDGLCRYTYEIVDGVPAPIRKYVIYLDESFLIANRNNLRSEVIDGLILHEIMHARDYFDNPDHLDTKFKGTYDAHGDHFQHLVATYGEQHHVDPRLVVGGSDIYAYTMSTYNRQTGTTKYAIPPQIMTTYVVICPSCGSFGLYPTRPTACRFCRGTDLIFALIPPIEALEAVKIYKTIKNVSSGRQRFTHCVNLLKRYTRGIMRKRLYAFLKNGCESYNKYPDEMDRAFSEPRKSRTSRPPIDRRHAILSTIQQVGTTTVRRFVP